MDIIVTGVTILCTSDLLVKSVTFYKSVTRHA